MSELESNSQNFEGQNAIIQELRSQLASTNKQLEILYSELQNEKRVRETHRKRLHEYPPNATFSNEGDRRILPVTMRVESLDEIHRFIWLADTHDFSTLHSEKSALNFLRWYEDEKQKITKPWVGLVGDLSNDDRSSERGQKKHFSKTTKRADTIKMLAAADDWCDKYRALDGDIFMGVLGNHWTEDDTGAITFDQEILSRFGGKYCGAFCWLIITVQYLDYEFIFVGLIAHDFAGYNGGIQKQTAHKRILEKCVKSGADFGVTGHYHFLGFDHVTAQYRNGSGHPEQRIVHSFLAGGYMLAWKDGEPGYLPAHKDLRDIGTAYFDINLENEWGDFAPRIVPGQFIQEG